MSAESFMFGKTVNGLAIPAFRFGSVGPEVLILGGVHGDEPEGVAAAHGLLAEFLQSFAYRLQVFVVPAFNLDGVIAKERTNSNAVDLNRNLPTKDWTSVVAKPRYNPGPFAESEPENQSLVSFIRSRKLRFVFSLHSWEPMLNTNGDCKGEAEILSKITGYKITDDIGYPTPGSLGTYTGLERNIPTLTYEIERGLALDKVVKNHVPAIIEALKFTETRES